MDPDRMDEVRVSVVVAARNAEHTLAETLDSLRAQTFEEWEAVVIDDGSADRTAEIARERAARDGRIRVFAQDSHGVSAARNRGLSLARHAWVLFLDADDLLRPHHLESLTGALEADPALEGAYCGYVRQAADGTRFGEKIVPDPGRLFEHFARSCVWAIHGCLIRRGRVEGLGGFPEGWQCAGDWDLWQRVARSSAPLACVPEALAIYRVRPGSLSLDVQAMVECCSVVVRRGHGPDPRVPDPRPEYTEGMHRAHLPAALTGLAAWVGGLAMGQGDDPLPVLERAAGEGPHPFTPDQAANNVFHAAILPRGKPPRAWVDLWPELEEPAQRLFEAIEARTGVPALARRARLALERRVLEHSEPPAPPRLGLHACATVEVTRPLRGVRVDPGGRRLACAVELEGGRIGWVHLPVRSGEVPARELADAVARKLGDRILARYQARWVFGDLGRSRVPWAWAARHLVRLLARLLPRRGDDFREWAHGAIEGLVLRREARSLADLPDRELRRLVVRDALLGRPIDEAPLSRRLVPPAPPGSGAGGGEGPGGPGSAATVDDGKGSATPPPAGPPPSRRRPLRDDLIYFAQRAVPRLRAAFPDRTVADRLPVLLYHHVGEPRSETLAPYYVDPGAFEEHLRFLREAGFRSVTLEDWARAAEGHGHLRGRPVLLTFDDGYRDFLTHAWPLLEEHGFGALVLLVAGEVGGRSRWDSAFGEEARLLSWDEIRALRSRGVEFGSHSVSHAPLTGLSADGVAREAEESRRILERELGEPVSAFAYPYGDADDAVSRLVRDAGYRFGLGCRGAVCRLRDDPFDLPRLSVERGDRVEDLLGGYQVLRAGR